MEDAALKLFDLLPRWLQVTLALATILVVLAPFLATYIARTVVEFRKFKHDLQQAREAGIAEVVRLLWAEGQSIKARLDKAGLSRGDFGAQLRQAAKVLLIDRGMPVELVDVILDRTRAFHKQTKTVRPQVVPGEVGVLQVGGNETDPPVGAGGTTPAPSSPASAPTGRSASPSDQGAPE